MENISWMRECGKTFAEGKVNSKCIRHLSCWI